MANVKVSELPTATNFSDDDYTMIVQNNTTKKISKQNMYGNYKFSTNETVIGEWINQKPLYRKTIYVDQFPSTISTYGYIVSYPTNISNLDTVVNLYGQYQGIINNVFTTRPINFHIYNADGADITTYVGDGNYIKIRTNNSDYSYNNFTGYVIIEYTKTTD